MLYYIYSPKYGWKPLQFLLCGKNFYKERKNWLSAHAALNGVFSKN